MSPENCLRRHAFAVCIPAGRRGTVWLNFPSAPSVHRRRPICQPAAAPDRHGGLHWRAPSQPQTQCPWARGTRIVRRAVSPSNIDLIGDTGKAVPLFLPGRGIRERATLLVLSRSTAVKCSWTLHGHGQWSLATSSASNFTRLWCLGDRLCDYWHPQMDAPYAANYPVSQFPICGCG